MCNPYGWIIGNLACPQSFCFADGSCFYTGLVQTEQLDLSWPQMAHSSILTDVFVWVWSAKYWGRFAPQLKSGKLVILPFQRENFYQTNGLLSLGLCNIFGSSQVSYFNISSINSILVKRKCKDNTSFTNTGCDYLIKLIAWADTCDVYVGGVL